MSSAQRRRTGQNLIADALVCCPVVLQKLVGFPATKLLVSAMDE
jgi:hypothetical protein